MGYINITAFIISFSIGILYAYLHIPSKKIIYIYPTFDNARKMQYQDKTDTCFNIKPEKTNCLDAQKNELFKKFKMQA
tara:strand:- start:257 stop:490 length:234 start_codon:yes stop_codon:yes gene_type:complete